MKSPEEWTEINVTQTIEACTVLEATVPGSPARSGGLTAQDLLATLRILVLTVNEMGSFLPREEKVTVTF